jgi:hypothetical protein
LTGRTLGAANAGMTRPDLFLILCIVSCGYAFARGGRSERICALAFAIGVILTFAAVSPLATRYRHVELSVAAIDMVSFLIVLAVALRSERYWPIWLSALYFLQVMSHLFRLLPGAIALIYGIMMDVWAYPMLLVIVIGTWRHRVRIRRRMVATF